MSEVPTLDFNTLQNAVAGEAAAVRCVTRLQPAGGRGDKVFPPTYAADRTARTRYAMELRRIDGQDVQTVLLDSVPSQANRLEEALLAAWEERRIPLPVIAVDFSGEEGLADIGRISTLQAPHRIADALLRDSVDVDGTRFRDTTIGKAYTEASVKNATAVFQYCPTALLFGVWDSTGPRGGLGNKIQRGIVSEIVGVGAVAGVKTESRLDPVGIQGKVEVYHHKNDHDDWTTDVAEAEMTKGNPVLFSRTGAEDKNKKKGKPSAVNHSNVTPIIDVTAGGVTIDYAVQTTVLSLPALRKLRFVTHVDGSLIEPETRPAVERAARTVLAALALVAVAEQRRRGYDLRSRSLLVPETQAPLAFELVPADGGEGVAYRLSPEAARTLLGDALRTAESVGLRWDAEPVVLTPASKLAGLIRESRKRAASGESDEAEGGA